MADRRITDSLQTDDNGTTLDKAGKTMTGIFGTTFEYHNFVTSAMLRVRFLSCLGGYFDIEVIPFSFASKTLSKTSTTHT